MDEPTPSTEADHDLLGRFARTGDESAFEALVRRYAALVCGVAIRRGVAPDAADDVAQRVFAVLARKAKGLEKRRSLAGWLARSAALEAAHFNRSERNHRRKMDQFRDDQSTAPSAPGPDEHAAWRRALPHLDAAMAELPDGDREVLLQRFYNGEGFAAIGELCGKSEAAAQKQGRRALDKLARLLKRRGVAVPTATVAALLGTELAKAAPAVAPAALASAALGASPTLAGSTLITNTLHTMAYAKTKTAVAVIALAAIPTGLQWNKIRALEGELADRPAAAAAGSAPAPAPAPPPARDAETQALIDGLQARITTLDRQLLAARDALAAAETQLAQAGGGSPMGDIAAMFEDPNMREVIRTQMRGQVSVMYADLFEHFGLDDAEEADLEALLVDRQMDLSVHGMRMMKPEGGDEESAEALDALTAVREASDAAIAELLGAERFSEFERYEDSQSERTELAQFRDALAAQGRELSPEVEEQLMAAMYEERNAFAFSQDFDPTGQDPGSWSPASDESMETQLREYRQLQRKIADRAAGVLPAEDLAVFESNQNTFYKLMEGSLQMSAKMFAPQGETGAGPEE